MHHFFCCCFFFKGGEKGGEKEGTTIMKITTKQQQQQQNNHTKQLQQLKTIPIRRFSPSFNQLRPQLGKFCFSQQQQQQQQQQITIKHHHHHHHHHQQQQQKKNKPRFCDLKTIPLRSRLRSSFNQLRPQLGKFCFQTSKMMFCGFVFLCSGHFGLGGEGG